MSESKFPVVNDATGEEAEVTVEEFEEDFRNRGFRIADVRLYYMANPDEKPTYADRELRRGEMAMQAQSGADATAAAERFYPQAKGGDADRKAAKEREKRAATTAREQAKEAEKLERAAEKAERERQREEERAAREAERRENQTLTPVGVGGESS